MGQVGAGDVLHREVGIVLDLAQLEHLHDVRVRERDRQLGFVDEHLHEAGVSREIGQDALDDEALFEALEADAARQEHFGHAALCEGLKQLVATERARKVHEPWGRRAGIGRSSPAGSRRRTEYLRMRWIWSIWGWA